MMTADGTHVPSSDDHAFTVQDTGKYARVLCGCGWKGKWRLGIRPDLLRALRSDENAHHYATKRAQEVSVTEHNVTLEKDSGPTARGIRAVCTCGWNSGWYGRHLPNAPDHVYAAARKHRTEVGQ